MEGAFLREDGAQVSLSWCAWRDDSKSLVRWDRRQVVTSVRSASRATTEQDHEWWKDRKRLIEAHMLLLGLRCQPPHVVESLRSAKASAAAFEYDYDGTDSLHRATLSTPALLAFLVGAQEWIRDRAARRQCGDLLKCLLSVTLPSSILADPRLEVRAACASGCEVDPVRGRCAHLRRCLLALQRAECAPQTKAALYFEALCLERACPACVSTVGELLTTLSDVISENLDATSSPFDPIAELKKREQKPDGKRGREIDQDIKSGILSKVARREGDNCADTIRTSCGNSMGNTGALSWREHDLASYQCAGWLHAAATRTISMTGDGSKVGCPAEETFIWCAWHARERGDFASWLAPAVPRGVTSQQKKEGALPPK